MPFITDRKSFKIDSSMSLYLKVSQKRNNFYKNKDGVIESKYVMSMDGDKSWPSKSNAYTVDIFDQL